MTNMTNPENGVIQHHPPGASLLRRLLRDDDLRNPWHVLFIRWVKHERVTGTNLFTDHTWLPRDIPYFPPARHQFECQGAPSARPITDVFRGLLGEQGEGGDPVQGYYEFEQRIFEARCDLTEFLQNNPAAFVVSMCIKWVLTKDNVVRRIALKGADNDPYSTVYKCCKIENDGDLVINPFTIGYDEWREWAENRLMYDFVRGVETQVLKLARRSEFYRRMVTCTWKPIDHPELSDDLLLEAIHRTLRIGSIRAVKMLKQVEVPGELEIELPVPFDLLYPLIARFRPIDLKTPFTKAFYPAISTFLGPGVKLGVLNLFDYFGVRWKCPCFWTGTSLFRVDRTLLW